MPAFFDTAAAITVKLHGEVGEDEVCSVSPYGGPQPWVKQVLEGHERSVNWAGFHHAQPVMASALSRAWAPSGSAWSPPPRPARRRINMKSDPAKVINNLMEIDIAESVGTSSLVLLGLG